MFSKEESKRIRQEFWIHFGKEHPHKWLLYRTKIKDVSLKFSFNTKKAQVSIDVASSDTIIRAYYFERLLSLKTILTTEYLENVIFDQNYSLENGKIVSRIYLELQNVNIYNRDNWKEVMHFLSTNMIKLEAFFIEYKDYIKA